jgi:hypothetical protein
MRAVCVIGERITSTDARGEAYASLVLQVRPPVLLPRASVVTGALYSVTATRGCNYWCYFQRSYHTPLLLLVRLPVPLPRTPVIGKERSSAAAERTCYYMRAFLRSYYAHQLLQVSLPAQLSH